MFLASIIPGGALFVFGTVIEDAWIVLLGACFILTATMAIFIREARDVRRRPGEAPAARQDARPHD